MKNNRSISWVSLVGGWNLFDSAVVGYHIDAIIQACPDIALFIWKNAEDIISQKLCSCIKKVDATNEQKSIGICTKTVINRKGMKRGKFNCKGKKYITIKKSKKNLSINVKKTIKNRK